MTQLPLDASSHKAEMLRAMAALRLPTSDSDATLLQERGSSRQTRRTQTRVEDDDEVLRLCEISEDKAEAYTKPFCEFLTENPTIFHAVDYFKTKLHRLGFEEVSCPPM